MPVPYPQAVLFQNVRPLAEKTPGLLKKKKSFSEKTSIFLENKQTSDVLVTIRTGSISVYPLFDQQTRPPNMCQVMLPEGTSASCAARNHSIAKMYLSPKDCGSPPLTVSVWRKQSRTGLFKRKTIAIQLILHYLSRALDKCCQ